MVSCSTDIVCSLKSLLSEDHAEVMVCIVCLYCSRLFSPTHTFTYLTVVTLQNTDNSSLMYETMLNPGLCIGYIIFLVRFVLSLCHRDYELQDK